MKKALFKSEDRGSANYGWLQARYSFSFANYYNPKSIHFGALRVLNDDYIAPGMGFGKHPHDNMEIITIPLSGSLKHRDSMSDTWIPLHSGEVQVMSAGSGIMHSEMNNSTEDPLTLFQVWIFPDRQDIKPKYEQKSFDESHRKNDLQTLVSSVDDRIEGALSIYQDARISRTLLEVGKHLDYSMKSRQHGLYMMVVSGEVMVEGELLSERDALGLWELDDCSVEAKSDADILFFEVPMLT